MENKWKFKTYDDDVILMLFDEVEEVEGDRATLTEWLDSDVQGSEYTLKILKKVLSGECKEDEFGGNAFEVHVEKDFTKISCAFGEQVPNIKPCIVPTELLYEIVKVWLSEREKFYANR